MPKLKPPVAIALLVLGLAFALFSAWKVFLDPYDPPPPVESGLPEGGGRQ